MDPCSPTNRWLIAPQKATDPNIATIYGELLVSPSPRIRHQEVLGRLHLAIGQYLAAERLSGLLMSPADISWGADTLVQPDLFVADANELALGEWPGVRTLHLVVEILSPSSIRADRFAKRRLHQTQGIPTYWVVDIENQLVEVWTPEAHFQVFERERVTWQHPKAAGVCAIDLRSVLGVGVVIPDRRLFWPPMPLPHNLWE